MDPLVAIALALGGYVLAIGLLMAVLHYVGQTRTFEGRPIPTILLVVLILLGPLGLLVGLLLLWFRATDAGRVRGPPPH